MPQQPQPGHERLELGEGRGAPHTARRPPAACGRRNRQPPWPRLRCTRPACDDCLVCLARHQRALTVHLLGELKLLVIVAAVAAPRASRSLSSAARRFSARRHLARRRRLGVPPQLLEQHRVEPR